MKRQQKLMWGLGNYPPRTLNSHTIPQGMGALEAMLKFGTIVKIPLTTKEILDGIRR